MNYSGGTSDLYVFTHIMVRTLIAFRFNLNVMVNFVATDD